MQPLYPINEQEFIALVEKGVSLERLERRLRPSDYLATITVENEEQDTFLDYSCGGFLGVQESLLECIHADWELVLARGTSHTTIADALERVISGAYKLHPNYEYMKPFFMTAGAQSCPWGCNVWGNGAGTILRKGLSEEEKREAELSQMGDINRVEEVVNSIAKERGETDATVRFFRKGQRNAKERKEPFYAPLTRLLPHLIREHYFFEGRESPYRTDPEFLIVALQLADS